MKESINYIGYKTDAGGKINAYVLDITNELGEDFKGTVLRYVYLTPYSQSYKKGQKGWVKYKLSRTRYSKRDFIWQSGNVKLNIAEIIEE
jgi:hypothetical protein